MHERLVLRLLYVSTSVCLFVCLKWMGYIDSFTFTFAFVFYLLLCLFIYFVYIVRAVYTYNKSKNQPGAFPIQCTQLSLGQANWEC